MLFLAVAGGTTAALIVLTGGLDRTLFGTTVTATNPLRPLLVGSLALTFYILAGGEIRVPRHAALERLAAACVHRVPWPATLAWALAAIVAVVTWTYGAKAVGGADSYGYMSQSELWAKGLPRLVQPIIAEVPWSNAAWTFSPVGAYRPMSSFRPVSGADRWTLVPVYPPGLPLLLTVAGAIGGYQAKFMVVPFFAGLLVLATYGIGIRLVSPFVGLTAAWLVATSPPVLFMSVVVMSDVPAAALWAAALFLTFGHGQRSAAAAGGVAALATLVRPNLAPLAPLLGLRYAYGLIDPATRRSSLREGALFGVIFALPVAALGLLHHQLYGSATASGYGVTSGFFETAHVVPNIQRYFGWLVESQTAVALVGFAALFVPIRRLWPRDDARIATVVAPLFVAAIWTVYIAYLVWEDWWYLRFVLPSYPLIMVGTGAVAAAVVRWRPREMAWITGAAVILLGCVQLAQAYDYGVQGTWGAERRYVMAARMVRQLTPRDSLVMANQHMATARYYGGRVSIRFDSLSGRWLDRSVRWLERRDVQTFLLLEDWEVPAFRERFAGTLALERLNRPPLAIYREPGLVYLYDLSGDAGPDQTVTIWSGVYRDLWAVPPAAEPARLSFER
jgi:hypothetical protein